MNITTTPFRQTHDDNSTIDFVEALYRGEIPSNKPLPGLTEDWYEEYCHYCRRQQRPADSISYFLRTLHIHFDLRPESTSCSDNKCSEMGIPRETTLMFGHGVLDDLIELGRAREPSMRKLLDSIFSQLRTQGETGE